jgi:hypothetical protein
VDGRIVGTITATVLLIVLGFVALGLYTSLPGLLIAGSLAAIGGAATAAVAEPARSGRNAVVVAAYVAILILGYILVGQAAGGYAPPRSRGGPGVMPPRETLYAVVAPDVATGRSCRFGWVRSQHVIPTCTTG